LAISEYNASELIRGIFIFSTSERFTMKRSTTIIMLLCAVALLVSAGTKKKFGKELSLKEKTKISSILAEPEKYNGKKVQVEGAVVNVCEKRGCWIMISGDKEMESIRFKVEDGVIVFPLDAKGKNVVAEGVVSVRTVSKEDLIEQGKKHAKETGTEFDPKSITEAQTIVQLKGEGAVVE
jgi:hypothetical protein